MEDAPVSNWVRLRRDFPPAASFTSSQYALTTDEKGTTETLVFHSRDTRDVVQVMLEDSITGASSPASILATDTPVDRIRLERFGKASVVLGEVPGSRSERVSAAVRPGFQGNGELPRRSRRQEDDSAGTGRARSGSHETCQPAITSGSKQEAQLILPARPESFHGKRNQRGRHECDSRT